ncbi:hypothetical protein B7H23_03560 [Notoacmeibacter marinus]|uniref:Uncharacterized protein n=1 Tax=Notoacmeibacter marinus TaxID=1876515 RepID=A0A231V1V2_9HYPH|nr:hypothetical protein [Notoacmeibacter marinus]OXT02021.1 hypothetical protein B7H23_03560 [Notoacmeibacter marinus]
MAAKRMIATDFIAIGAGGVLGAVATNLVVSIFTDGAAFQDLMVMWGRYVVAIAVTASFPFLYKALPKSIAAILSLLVGIVVPSVLARLFFGGNDLSWLALFAIHTVFAIIALMVYRAMHAWAKGALFKAPGFRA